jgi:hypothetical protein
MKKIVLGSMSLKLIQPFFSPVIIISASTEPSRTTANDVRSHHLVAMVSGRGYQGHCHL